MATAAEPDSESALGRRFELRARGTTLRTEVLSGFTTFLTMAYIVLVNPAILGQAGMPVAAVAFLSMAMIPLTFSIANGLAFGITAFALIKLLRGKIRWTDWLLLLLSALFVARFVWLSAG
jgi:xanthine/uracil/vitamin C permease (AzgA family)